jgi:hypothetical protein
MGAIMPSVKPNESEKDYIGRCIPYVMKEGTAKDSSQAAAICHSLYKKHLRASFDGSPLVQDAIDRGLYTPKGKK